ncbi:MAG: tRNA (adenosine(37)-N6)-threonylcarbamoyltransferase complex ATPase subunit type 1 TsaE [Pseudomonadota bacterium]
MIERFLPTEAAMEALGAELAKICAGGAVVYLHGELGAGKTTLVRGLLRALGHQGAVKSPTFTLVESYELGGMPIYHFDLYRINNAAELEHLGLEDYFLPANLCLVEWPERGADRLPPPDLYINLSYAAPGRRATLEARSGLGERMLKALAS